jgi:Zn-dependent peptidase ImmA (M78 family)
MPDRRALGHRAMLASITARSKAEMDLQSPICIYALSKAHRVQVRFNNINMEGMYQRGASPRIHLSARRPLPRRAFNCAHELGHHVFGHGSSIDELREDAKAKPWEDPKEFTADAFAGFVLMPTLGLRHAFASRSWKLETAAPRQLFQIACEFGVGYATLITHLSHGLGMLSRSRAAVLQRVTPKAIRAEILGALSPNPLVIADRAWASPVLDAEVGMHLVLPASTQAANDAIVPMQDLPCGRLFEAVRPGICRITQPGTSWAVFARIARREYVGLADFRHLEDDPDE